MRNGIRALLAAALVFAPLVTAAPALADITVDVNQAAVQPLPIAITPFGGSPTGAQISQVVSADLERSGLFRPLDPSSFRERPDVNVTPGFDNWKAIAAQALLVGNASIGGDGRLSVDFRLWDVYSGDASDASHAQLLGTRLTATPDSWRTIAHQIADAVYEKLTGEKGYFDTRVVFVAESGPKTHRVTRLAIMDQDGANPSYLTDGSAMVFAPRFSTRRQEITYMVLRPTGASIYLKNLETGREEVLGRFPDMTMTMAPRFSPDDSKVAFAAEKGGAVNIYVMNLVNHQVRRLTDSISIDTSPSFSADGGQIVFNSDRGGSPQLYVMSAEGGGAHRISFGAGRYNAPVWSPDGKLIAFVKQQGASFSIGVMNPDGSGERILTTSYFADEPVWAPNGRVIMFERKLADGASRLWTVDLSGHIQKDANYPFSGSDPAWSPLLH
ncbi:MAG TPA: Tol-Pal system beta propeller repeat protein TolB [Caulobacteraceae bacterium]|jgi:TolB protein|nr:Tol-Pal system beta propeller repeat protein TolB [Caulobacteraceae bacterium]